MDLDRPITTREYEQAVEWLEEFGLSEGWTQDPREAPERFRPDFNRETPFEAWTGVSPQ